MKTMILILPIFFLITGCGEEEPKQQLDTNSIYGTWQLVERWSLVNVGYVPVKMSVANGYTMSLMRNNSFSSTEFTVCQNSENNGNFTLNQSTSTNFIEISLNCNSTNNQLIRVYSYSFEDEYLILSAYSHPCDEGCAFKYKKIADPKEGD